MCGHLLIKADQGRLTPSNKKTIHYKKLDIDLIKNVLKNPDKKYL